MLGETVFGSLPTLAIFLVRISGYPARFFLAFRIDDVAAADGHE